MGSDDNCIEWFTGAKKVGVTFSQRKWITKLKKYAKDYPDDVNVLAENEDGSIYAHVPLSWVKLSPPKKGREFTEEERAQAAERLRIAREKKKNGKN